MNEKKLSNFTDLISDESCDSQPLSLSLSNKTPERDGNTLSKFHRPPKYTGQRGNFRSVEEIDPKYQHVFTYPYFNLVQSMVIEDALYSNKSIVVCAPTGSGKTVVFEMAIVQLLMELEDNNSTDDFKIIYMAPVKALCTERLTEWHSKFTKLGLLCIEVTGDTDVDFPQLQPYRIIITTPEKWDMLTRRWKDHRGLVEIVKLFLIDEVHILNDELRGPVLESVVSRMKTIETSVQSAHRIEQLQAQYQGTEVQPQDSPPRIRFVAVSATVSNPEDVAAWLGTRQQPAAYYKFGDECRPVKLKRVVEGYPCPNGTSIFKFDIILNYKIWPIIQKYHNGKPTLIFCNTRKGVVLTAETLSKEITVTFNPEQKTNLIALATTIKNKKVQSLILCGVGCHHAGLLYEERTSIEHAFRNRDLPILITTTTLAMGVNLPAHLVIVKNTQQYVNGAYQEYSISTVLQMVGRAGRPQFDTEATAVIMTRLQDKGRYQALVGGSEPLQSYLHKRLAENLNSEAALGTVGDVAQCVQWVNSTFLSVRAARDPRRYLNLPPAAPADQICKKIEELCVRAINGLASAGLITMDEVSCIQSTEAGRLMSLHYLDLETMKLIMKLEGTESLEHLLWLVCESHELSDMHLRVDERRCLNALNRNNAAATIRFPMKGKINSRQMKLNCVIQAVLGCLPIPDPSLNQEAMKIMRTADRVCKCLVSYVTRSKLMSENPKFYSAILNSLILAKCISAHLWENSPYVSRQLKGIGPTYSTLLAFAGKINFMVLEESHPRDLERIMNKGPPAGNILRKQVGLLPKYNLTMTPVDDKVVRVQLTLINLTHLMENMEDLTAGVNHKSYLVVGDSENCLLHFATFKESDLIRIYEGGITFEVTRKHTNEHKVVAHCVSSTLVGIDEQCEYLFMNINRVSELNKHNDFSIPEVPAKRSTVSQSTISDVFKARKRKIDNKNQTIQSKEKKKKDKNVINTFISLKNSVEKTAAAVEVGVNNTIDLSHNFTETNASLNNKSCTIINVTSEDDSYENAFLEAFEYDDVIHEEQTQINLTDTQTDIEDKKTSNPDVFNTLKLSKHNQVPELQKDYPVKYNKKPNELYQNANVSGKGKKVNTKNNYSFLKSLEKKHLYDENDIDTKNENGFSETVKSQLEKYLRRTEDKYKTRYNSIDIMNSSSKIQKHETPKDSADIVNEKSFQKCNDGDYCADRIVNLNTENFEDNNKTKIQSKLTPTHKKERNFPYTVMTGQTSLKSMNNNTAPMRQRTIPECHGKDSKEIIFRDANSATLQKGLSKNKEYAITPVLPIFSISHIDELPITVNNDNEIGKSVSENIKPNFIAISNDFYNHDDHNSSPNIFRKQNSEDGIGKIRHYAFDQTKTFHICTENNFKQQVEVISKLKLNWDVTEIVYKNTEQHANCGESKFNDNFNDALGVFSDHVDFKKDISNNDNVNVTKIEKTANECITGIHNEVKTDSCWLKQNKINSLKAINVKTVLPLSVHNGNESKTDVSSISMPLENEDKKDNYKNGASDQENTLQPNVTVKDILQKYSNIFKSQNNIVMCEANKIPRYSQSKDIGREISKANKKFQMYDMFNIQTPLSQSLNFENVTAKTITRVDNCIEKESNGNVYEIEEDVRNATEGAKIISLKMNSVKNTDSHSDHNESNSKINITCQLENENIKSSNQDTRLSGDTAYSVKDIVQKYNDISKSPNAGIYETKTVTKNRMSEEMDTKQRIPKSSKKYKIRDMDKPEKTLPQSIIENHQNIVPHQLYSLVDNTACKDICKIQGTIQKSDNKEIQDSSTENYFNLNIDNSIEEEALEILTCDVMLSHSPSTSDYNIDQALLNPKTLLECFGKEENAEIVPPPSEFCDDHTFYKDLTDKKLDTENDEDSYLQYKVENNDNTNIFQKHSTADLTPLKDIEILSQSREDDTSDFAFNFAACQSYDRIHKNPTENKCKLILSNSRKAKLSYYKFERKSIFKK